MLQLLQNYSVEETLIFIVILACAVKGVITFIEWAHNELKSIFNKGYGVEQEKEKMKNDIDNINKMQTQHSKDIEELTKLINLLISSDKDDIKAWITEKHHYFCYEVGAIDDYSLDCIEKRFKHYVDEGGNSFIADLMADLRALPKVSTVNKNDIKKQ